MDEMFLTLIFYRSSLESEVLELLAERGVVNYTKWSQISGKGSSSEPHLGTHIWPGVNNALAILVTKDQVEHIYEVVNFIKKQAPKEGIKAITLPVTSHT